MKAERFSAQKRDKVGSSASRQLRQSGRVPAVIYGLGKETVSVEIDKEAIDTMLRHHARMVDLDLAGTEETVLLKDIHYSPYDEILNVDFTRIDASQPVTTFVELEFVGTPKGVLSGGIFEQIRTDIEIQCLPKNIPAKIEVEVGHLDHDDTLHASDLKMPEGIQLEADEHLVICGVLPPKKAAEPTEGEEGGAVAEGGEASEG